MEDPTEVLRSEHVDVEGVLSVLESMAGRKRGMANVPVADLDNIMVILEEYANLCHHSK